MVKCIYFAITSAVFCVQSIALAQSAELNPTVSIVDFLKATGQPSDLSDRKKLYEQHFGETNYSGKPEQNVRLLTKLVSENAEAKASANKSLDTAQTIAVKERDRNAESTDAFACPGWVPAEGFGVNGSYGFTTRAHIVDGKLIGENFVVIVSSAAALLGKMDVSGKVMLFSKGDNEPFAEFAIVQPWFDTIGNAQSVARYGAKGTMIEIPRGKDVYAQVSIYPTVKTTAGTVALWSCTRKIMLTK